MSQGEGTQRVGLSVGGDLNAAATESFWLELFYGDSNEHLSGSPSPALSGASTAKHGTLYTNTDHHSCAIPCRQRSQDGKIHPANATSPDNRGKRHHQETSRENQRSSWGSPFLLAA